MNVKIRIITAAAAVLFIASAAGTALLFRPVKKRKVEISQDGQVIFTIDLDFAENQSFTVKDKNGGTNTVVIENGEIYISEANCPDKTCVRMGKLKSADLPVVCLPHKLIIRFAGGGDEE